MAKIPVYDDFRIQARATPNFGDPNAIALAGSTARGISQIAGQAAEMFDLQRQAREVTETNLAVIENKKRKIDFMDQARKKSMADPVGFSKRAEEELKKIDEEMAGTLSSGRAKNAFLQSSQQVNLSLYDDNLAWENKRQTEQHAERIEASVETLGALAFRAGKEGKDIQDLRNDADATLVAASTFVAPEKLAEIKRKIYGNITETWISGIADTNPSKAKKLLDTRKYDADLGSDGLEKAYGLIDQKQKKYAAEAKEAILQESADLDIAIDLAESPEEIEALKSRTEKLKGSISPSAYASKMIRSNHKLKEVAKENETRLKVATALEGREPIDLSDTDVKKAVGKQYAAVTGQIANAPEEKQAEVRASFAAQIGAVPAEMKREVTGMLRSQDETQVIMGANTINLVRTRNPEIAADFPDETLRQANTILSNISSGYDPKEAVKRAREVATVDSATKDARKQEYKDAVSDKPNSKYLTNELDEWGFDPDVDAVMVEEFSRAAELEYTLTGDMESARKTALDLTMRSWGKSEINGEEKWMKFPPEKHYSLSNLSASQNAEWMRNQLAEDLKPLKIDTENVRLVADNRKGEKPSYVVMHKDDRGIINVLLDANGKPMLWRPDAKNVLKKAIKKRGVK